MANAPLSLDSDVHVTSSLPALGGWDEHVAVPPIVPLADVKRGEYHDRESPSVAALLGASSLPIDREQNSRLLTARLGIAAGLFTALRYKHAETAAHSIRVAITCSIWAAEKQFTGEDREALEIAALLHDIGKTGLPDSILLKASKLTDEEQEIVDRHPLMGAEILASCCGSQAVLDIVKGAAAWYNGRRSTPQAEGPTTPPAEGRSTPVGARMLAIADAYDSMTSSQVYRPARSHERAIQELFACAGSQFDPLLVQEFAALPFANRARWPAQVERHWLLELDPAAVNLQWQLKRNVARPGPVAPPQVFQERLLDNMHDAVIFVDANRQITLWNRGAERLTGIDAANAIQRVFNAELIHLRNERGEICDGELCPTSTALRTGLQSAQRFIIRGRNARDLMVDAQSIPVVGDDTTPRGVAIVLHDASGQVSLEERCLSLQQKATRDPLTQLSNRAEFDRFLALFVGVHLERRAPCSLIIADIDRFKQINDNYGHQAGDEAIKSFAHLFKTQCKPGDLAARYGGEEFVLLCANCNNAEAASRAEKLRQLFSELPQREMASICITASFGVTEIQPGDTPETMLRRADRALLLAKDTGRNKVVQLGDGLGDPQPERRRTRWWPWPSAAKPPELQSTWLTTVPLRVAIEKLRGFIADNDAQIVSIVGNDLVLEVNEPEQDRRRRTTDRAAPMLVELRFVEEALNVNRPGGDDFSQRTRIEVAIRPKRLRDRRQDSTLTSARRLSMSLRAYLMAFDCERVVGESENVTKTTQPLLPWLSRSAS
jgi:diguanylate cyclase (GGDEF)-like protein/putative nucleotidyltransferase with HDIG domain